MRLRLLDTYLKVWGNIPRLRRVQLFGLILLMVITSISEVLSIGSIIPFIGILISPEKLETLGLVGQLMPFNWSDLDKSTTQFYITLVFAVSVLIAGFLRILLVFCQVKLSHYLGVEFGTKVFASLLALDYQEHTSSNTSEMIVAVAKAQELIPYLLQPTLVILSSGMIAISIFFSLLYVDYFLTLISVFFL